MAPLKSASPRVATFSAFAFLLLGAPSARAGSTWECIRNQLLSPENTQDYEFARLLGSEATKDLKNFRPAQGFKVTKRDARGNALSGRFRTMVNNQDALGDHPRTKYYLVGDFNRWGKAPAEEMERWRLVPEQKPGEAWNPYATTKEIPLQKGMEYRILVKDEFFGWKNEKTLLDPTNEAYSTAALLKKLGKKSHPYYNSVFWDLEGPQHQALLKHPSVDWRNTPGGEWTEEVDLQGLVAKWKHNGKTGPSEESDTYNFVTSSGIIEYLKSRGVTRVKLLPINQRLEEPGWQYSYQTYPWAIDCNMGSPDEFAKMIDKFNENGIAVVVDSVVGHFPERGNFGVREISEAGIHNFRREDGTPVYGAHKTEWDTRQYRTGDPEVRRYLTDANLGMMKYYGISGIRLDNVSGGFNTGIFYRDGGWQFLKDLNGEIHAYRPGTFTNAEAFFEIPKMTKGNQHIDGLGFNTSNHGYFFEWLRKNMQKYTGEIDMDELRHVVRGTVSDRQAARTTYITNHDEASNPSPEGGATGAYPAEILKGGGWFYSERKPKAYTTLAAAISGDFQTMPQAEIGQFSNFAHQPYVDWSLLESNPGHKRQYDFYGSLAKYYTSQPAFNIRNLHENMENHVDEHNKIISIWREDKRSGKKVLVVVNLGDHAPENYRIGVPAGGTYDVKVDSQFGEDSSLPASIRADNRGEHGKPQSIVLSRLAPYQAVILERR